MNADAAGVPYDTRALQSLFGYGRGAHGRSGGICQLCGCGSERVDFDLWRQFTVEHVIGQGQGGYLPRIRGAVEARFAHLGQEERSALAMAIHEANMVTACQFCNSATSRDRAARTMEEEIARLPSEPAAAVAAITVRLGKILAAKRQSVDKKLRVVRAAFEREIEPELRERRGAG